jgi:hypothetical protein
MASPRMKIALFWSVVITGSVVLANLLREARSEPPAQPPAAVLEKVPVQLHILVIEADKKSDRIDKAIELYKPAMPGYRGGKLLDELNASAEEGASVSLEIMRQNGKSRLLRVTVEDVTPPPEKNIKLRVAIDALKFNAETTHKNGATLLIHHPLSKDKALFLAVTPKVP